MVRDRPQGPESRDPGEVTVLLQQAAAGDRQALDSLFESIYGELNRLARIQRSRWIGDETLNATALVHEAYVKLVGAGLSNWHDRAHFFAVASRAMRQILVSYSDPFGLDPCKSSSAWTECLAQGLADWGARRGGRLGGAALFAGAFLNAGLEASGINLAATAGDAIGSGDVGGALYATALTFVPGAKVGRGLRNASAGLSGLFKAGGGLADNTLIGIRSGLIENGFTMSLADNGAGYLFTNAAGEQVRLMSQGAGSWYLRIRNAAGNYLDDLGNPASNAASHLPIRNH